MITYRYVPYDPDENDRWDVDRLMGILSEMILKYDIELEEGWKKR